MPLDGRQINELTELMGRWGFAALETFVSDFGLGSVVDLGPSQSTEELARRFLNRMNSERRDREVLEALQKQGSAILKRTATAMLMPPFRSPNGDAHEAFLLDRTAFVDREPLRIASRRLTAYTTVSTRVLVVRGETASGKSHSWRFLHHLAVNEARVIPQHLELKDSGFTPREIFQEVFKLLQLKVSAVPPMPDDPQLAHIPLLVNAFKGKIVTLKNAYWLVIDDLNDPSVTPAMSEAVYAIAKAVEDVKPPNLWVVLLGYNQQITDNALRHIGREEAQFPDSGLLAEHFELVARDSPKPLPREKALEIATKEFAQFPTRNKAARIALMERVEEIDDGLLKGVWP